MSSETTFASLSPGTQTSEACPVWFDGSLVPSRQANVHILTHSLHMAGAVFEGIRPMTVGYSSPKSIFGVLNAPLKSSATRCLEPG